MSLETEAKLYVSDLSAVQQRLETLGAALHKPRLFERNIRYENVENSLTPNHIVLRLRQDDRVRLTYKEPTSQQLAPGAVTRVELETEISDFEMMHAILQKLGYHSHLTYEKYRTTYHLNNLEVVLDEMPYGNFVEIEGAAQGIEAAIQQLRLGEAPHILASYTDLFEIIKGALGLTFRDLTFANFAGLVIPGELFQVPYEGDWAKR